MKRTTCFIALCCFCLLISGCFPDTDMVRRMEQRSIDRTSVQTQSLRSDHKAIAEVVAPAAVPIIDANRETADQDKGAMWKILAGLLGMGGASVFAARKMSGSGDRIARTEDRFETLKDEVLRNMTPPTGGGSS